MDEKDKKDKKDLTTPGTSPTDPTPPTEETPEMKEAREYILALEASETKAKAEILELTNKVATLEVDLNNQKKETAEVKTEASELRKQIRAERDQKPEPVAVPLDLPGLANVKLQRVTIDDGQTELPIFVGSSFSDSHFTLVRVADLETASGFSVDLIRGQSSDLSTMVESAFAIHGDALKSAFNGRGKCPRVEVALSVICAELATIDPEG